MDWDRLENKLLDYQNIALVDKNMTAEKSAGVIELMYTLEIMKSGKDQYGNKVVRINTGLLSAAMKTSMEATIKAHVEIPDILNKFLLSGLPLMWTGAVLGITFPPPGAISAVSNIVTSPGITPTLDLPNSKPKLPIPKINMLTLPALPPLPALPALPDQPAG